MAVSEINQIKIGSTEVEIVPKKIKSGNYILNPPAITKNETIATEKYVDDNIPIVTVSPNSDGTVDITIT